jgi:pimeloyl-ACP methyl ester carboxylesterase
MTASFLLLAAATSLAAPGDRARPSSRVVEFRGDPAPGLLVNCSPGARPFDPPDPSRPTVVFVHGSNPVPSAVRYPMAQRLGEAVGRRAGNPCLNVLGWDWNGNTVVSLNVRANHENAVQHGRLLAGALLARGVAPGRTHLVGQSAGAIVAASAANALIAATGQQVGQVTLLDPATYYHDIVFGRLAVGSCARVAEHYWAPGPTGFSRSVVYPGVRDLRLAVPGTWRGVVDPFHSAHVNAVRWYIDTAADPSYPGGFNTSVCLGQGG